MNRLSVLCITWGLGWSAEFFFLKREEQVDCKKYTPAVSVHIAPEIISRKDAIEPQID